MTRIVITGACGKMGRVINDIVNTRDDCEITAGIDIAGEQYADFPVYKKLRVCRQEVNFLSTNS